MWQTDGLDQGEALASHIFGYAIAYIIHHRLLPSVPSLISTLIHDDLTLSDFTLSASADHSPPTPPPATPDATTPLPYAITLFRDLALAILRCVLAERKTTLHQALPPSDPASVVHSLHLFPAGTTVTHTYFILGGCPVGQPEALPIALAAELDRYIALLTRLAELTANCTRAIAAITLPFVVVANSESSLAAVCGAAFGSTPMTSLRRSSDAAWGIGGRISCGIFDRRAETHAISSVA